jgi:hypothetical protein
VPPRPPRFLPTVLALAVLASGAARAGEPPGSGPAGGTAVPGEGVAGAPEVAPPAPPQGEPPAEDTWLDVGHAFVEQRLFAPVLWFDRFFSDERETEAERSRSFLRWRTEARLEEGASRPALTTGVRVTLRLPGLGRRLHRLRLVIAGETHDTVSALFPREPTAPGTVDPAEDDVMLGNGDAGLRYYFLDSVLAHADLGGGVLLELPPGVYGRLRFRWAIPVGTLFLTRAVLTGFWRSDVGLGASGTLELERPVARSALARLSGAATRSEESRGAEWSAEAALLASLSRRVAAQIAAAISGATGAEAIAPGPVDGAARAAPVPAIERFRAYLRLRRDVYRRWLFLEVEPEVAWPWSPERGRYAAWAVALRAEVQVQGRDAPPHAPPPPPPEPADPPPDPLEEARADPGTSRALPPTPSPR